MRCRPGWARVKRSDRDPLSCSSDFDVTAVVAPGLEEVAAAELQSLGASSVQPLRRAVACRCDPATFWRLHLRARLPFRLLRHLARFACDSRNDLPHQLPDAADWEQWLPPHRRFRVDVSGGSSAFPHSHYTALAVKNALVDLQRQRWGERSMVDLDNPDVLLHLHIGRAPGGAGGHQAVLSVVGDGASLHRRGWRAAMGQAPLKENLAAGLIALTGWDGSVPLVDPMCGSGTLLIEAATAALGRAPGLGRSFLFQRWPDFQPDLWQQELQQAQALARNSLADGRPLAPIIGMELDPEVQAQACANASAAGVAPWLTLQQGDALSLLPPEQAGVLVCNPPYGERIGERGQLWDLYDALGRHLKQHWSGWTLWLLSGQAELSGALRLKTSRRIPVSNGGIDCRWLRYEIR